MIITILKAKEKISIVK